uniref:Uncharacterized protein n=1 Tax=Chromera velia CCMP2878 TaxID=1169474 RepID=A0A0G4H4K6_9ALVE|eukprot:Cvel_843.t1-p1 / transcript=Cvel_843.t1 / gene=Cvel_843 / organism=Chromera_velia_CCMP2878 / gene_product=hypothetical protein / transcript_product=hypothetical protein / location=Cvel_scaffold26:81994-97532(+) / protein_length=1301 / sequence_SO=supercontig / SO=protein_coding / is_pseudo=false
MYSPLAGFIPSPLCTLQRPRKPRSARPVDLDDDGFENEIEDILNRHKDRQVQREKERETSKASKLAGAPVPAKKSSLGEMEDDEDDDDIPMQPPRPKPKTRVKSRKDESLDQFLEKEMKGKEFDTEKALEEERERNRSRRGRGDNIPAESGMGENDFPPRPSSRALSQRPSASGGAVSAGAAGGEGRGQGGRGGAGPSGGAAGAPGGLGMASPPKRGKGRAPAQGGRKASSSDSLEQFLQADETPKVPGKKGGTGAVAQRGPSGKGEKGRKETGGGGGKETTAKGRDKRGGDRERDPKEESLSNTKASAIKEDIDAAQESAEEDYEEDFEEVDTDDDVEVESEEDEYKPAVAAASSALPPRPAPKAASPPPRPPRDPPTAAQVKALPFTAAVNASDGPSRPSSTHASPFLEGNVDWKSNRPPSQASAAGRPKARELGTFHLQPAGGGMAPMSSDGGSDIGGGDGVGSFQTNSSSYVGGGLSGDQVQARLGRLKDLKKLDSSLRFANKKSSAVDTRDGDEDEAVQTEQAEVASRRSQCPVLNPFKRTAEDERDEMEDNPSLIKFGRGLGVIETGAGAESGTSSKGVGRLLAEFVKNTGPLFEFCLQDAALRRSATLTDGAVKLPERSAQAAASPFFQEKKKSNPPVRMAASLGLPGALQNAAVASEAAPSGTDSTHTHAAPAAQLAFKALTSSKTFPSSDGSVLVVFSRTDPKAAAGAGGAEGGRRTSGSSPTNAGGGAPGLPFGLQSGFVAAGVEELLSKVKALILVHPFNRLTDGVASSDPGGMGSQPPSPVRRQPSRALYSLARVCAVAVVALGGKDRGVVAGSAHGSLMLWDLEQRPHVPVSTSSSNSKGKGSMGGDGGEDGETEGAASERLWWNDALWLRPKQLTDSALMDAGGDADGDAGAGYGGSESLLAKGVHEFPLVDVSASDPHANSGDGLVFALDASGGLTIWRLVDNPGGVIGGGSGEGEGPGQGEEGAAVQKFLVLTESSGVLQGSRSLPDKVQRKPRALGGMHGRTVGGAAVKSAGGVGGAAEGPAPLRLEGVGTDHSSPVYAAFNPFVKTLLLVAFSNGDLILSDVASTVPVTVWTAHMRGSAASSGSFKAVALAWSPTRPCVFFSCRSPEAGRDLLDIWDLAGAASLPPGSASVGAPPQGDVEKRVAASLRPVACVDLGEAASQSLGANDALMSSGSFGDGGALEGDKREGGVKRLFVGPGEVVVSHRGCPLVLPLNPEIVFPVQKPPKSFHPDKDLITMFKEKKLRPAPAGSSDTSVEAELLRYLARTLPVLRKSEFLGFENILN